ncbi:hypothetical protein KIN20_029504 [Parelaphostrongylus tenuis]|uniref:Uncharacterized protein n=1 Tax=Parelaphostrongylus tenuis TaxID=148309 RepID=A0AAD5R2Q5_PARTN|nr:hypothetical protein KIN20_029504 [Parelaphostrongylus tenuis]
MENNVKEELDKRRKAAWAAFSRTHRPNNGPQIMSLSFQFSSPHSALLRSDTQANTSTTSRLQRMAHRALERCLLRICRHSQHLAGLRSSGDRRAKRTMEWTPNTVSYTSPRLKWKVGEEAEEKKEEKLSPKIRSQAID